nr:unnamed protein product [Haemonchus contortus]
MRIDGMRAAGIARLSQSSWYVTFDCRPRAVVLHLLLLLLLIPAANSLTYFVGTSVKQMGPADVTQKEPFLSKDDKQTIVMFCRAALSSSLSREKIKDPGNEKSRRRRSLYSEIVISYCWFSLSEMDIHTLLQDLITSKSNAFHSSTFNE